jgi:hypothetical protein
MPELDGASRSLTGDAVLELRTLLDDAADDPVALRTKDRAPAHTFVAAEGAAAAARSAGRCAALEDAEPTDVCLE